MPKRKLLILGAGPWQGWLIKTAKKMGVETIVVDGNPRAKWHSIADEFSPIDIKKEKEILSFARDKRVDGVLTSSSDVSLPTLKYLLGELNLTGPCDFAIENTINKYKMHKMFDKHAIPSCRYFLLESCSQAAEAISHVGGLPVVFKPLDNAGGRGVIVVSSDGETEDAYDYTRSFSQSDFILVEKFVAGEGVGAEIFSVGGNIYLCILMNDHYIPNYISPIGHILPARLKENVKERIKDYISKICGIFQLTDGNFNIDMKMTDEGPCFIEINPRMGGSNISELVYYSTGIDLAEYAIRHALDLDIRKDPPVPQYRPSISALLFSQESGIVRRHNPYIPAGSEMNIIKEYEISSGPGDLLQTHEKLVALVGWVIASGSAQKDNWNIIKAMLSHEHLIIDED